MLILWFLTGASLATSLVALVWARRAAKRLEELSQLYWELRYQQSELRTRLNASGKPEKAQDSAEASPRTVGDAFVPLSAVRR